MSALTTQTIILACGHEQQAAVIERVDGLELTPIRPTALWCPTCEKLQQVKE